MTLTRRDPLEGLGAGASDNYIPTMAGEGARRGRGVKAAPDALREPFNCCTASSGSGLEADQVSSGKVRSEVRTLHSGLTAPQVANGGIAGEPVRPGLALH
jgi:hypothetical protein